MPSPRRPSSTGGSQLARVSTTGIDRIQPMCVLSMPGMILTLIAVNSRDGLKRRSANAFRPT
ncbi:hypothetical protein AWB69_07541 [Caballeronia udeis]|uniref:Uncharacterized protein n=1 Tax=Caballeronia udeis TaxID=1232866 RepID=A0A158JDR4_9BURK|nr:hypothetical protein AWB69_07541 [Caballeronia udeis]